MSAAIPLGIIEAKNFLKISEFVLTRIKAIRFIICLLTTNVLSEAMRSHSGILGMIDIIQFDSNTTKNK